MGRVRVGRALTTQGHLGLNCDGETWLCEESRDKKKQCFKKEQLRGVGGGEEGEEEECRPIGVKENW